MLAVLEIPGNHLLTEEERASLEYVAAWSDGTVAWGPTNDWHSLPALRGNVGATRVSAAAERVRTLFVESREKSGTSAVVCGACTIVYLLDGGRALEWTEGMHPSVPWIQCAGIVRSLVPAQR